MSNVITMDLYAPLLDLRQPFLRRPERLFGQTLPSFRSCRREQVHLHGHLQAVCKFPWHSVCILHTHDVLHSLDWLTRDPFGGRATEKNPRIQHAEFSGHLGVSHVTSWYEWLTLMWPLFPPQGAQGWDRGRDFRSAAVLFWLFGFQTDNAQLQSCQCAHLLYYTLLN